MTRKPINISRKLIVDQEFFNFLINSNSIIGNIILNIDMSEEINYIASTDVCDKISYLPQSKFKNESEFDPFAKNVGRVQLKVGRFLTKLLSPQIIESFDLNKTHVEKFVNAYKSWFDTTKFRFEIVEGEDIRKWYLEDNYFAPNGNRVGTLWNSCTRYGARMKFLDLYCKNPIKMLVMLQEVDDEVFVRSRALLWDYVTVIKDHSQTLPEKIKVMDRIYSVFDSDVDHFKKWAHNNGYIPKYEQNAKSHQFFDIKGEVTRIQCEIKLEKSNLRYYPYLDTFPFLNWKNGIISNDEYHFSWDYKLVQADGNLERVQETEETNDEDW